MPTNNTDRKGRHRFDTMSDAVEWFRGQPKGLYRAYFFELDINSDPRMFCFKFEDSHAAAGREQAANMMSRASWIVSSASPIRMASA